MEMGWMQRGGARAGRLACVLAAAVLTGCGSGEPSRELTVDERASLLREIRSDKSRVKDLTPAERKYLLERMGK